MVHGREWTVGEMARNEGVTERTVYNWMRKGAVAVRRTPGGGVRVRYVESQAVQRRVVFVASGLKSSETA